MATIRCVSRPLPALWQSVSAESTLGYLAVNDYACRELVDVLVECPFDLIANGYLLRQAALQLRERQDTDRNPVARVLPQSLDHLGSWLIEVVGEYGGRVEHVSDRSHRLSSSR